MTKMQDKARLSKRKAARAAKDIIIPSLPGVSKLKLPQTPVPSLLQTNSPPSDSDIILVKKAIVDAELTVSQLKQKLDRRIVAGRANRGWETVTRHKIGQATRFVQQHRGIISPLRRLPLEILQEIFVWATLHVRPHNRYRTVSELPWRLSQVCRYWRASALSMSSLWSYIPTLQLKKSRPTTKRQVDYVTELLRRSGQTPLDIYIWSPYYDHKSHPILDILLPHSNRWQMLTIEATPIVIAGLGAAKGRLALLKYLTLQTPWHRYFDGPSAPLDTFEIAPQLETVSVSGPFVGEVKLPFSQLVHYKERRIASNLMNQVISSALLESLTILELSDQIVFPAVTLPHLVKLQVKFQHESIGNSLDNLTLPAIEEIRAVAPVGNLIARLATLISRSNTPCRLKTLCIRTEFIEPGDLTSLLKLTPDLVDLDTTITKSNNFVDITSLGYKDSSTPLVPRLESCRFYIEEAVSAETSQALNELATFRCELESQETEGAVSYKGEIQPLKNLSVYFDATTPPWSDRQQAELEGWCTSITSTQLAVAKTQLIFAIPDLINGGLGKLTSRDKSLSKKVIDRVDSTLALIDKIQIDDPAHIYVRCVVLLLLLDSPRFLFSSDRPLAYISLFSISPACNTPRILWRRTCAIAQRTSSRNGTRFSSSTSRIAAGQ